MWVKVRNMDGSKSIRVDDLSKLTKIEELRARLVDSFDVAPERQRLFYRGKQLEDTYTLFDYDVGLNDIIQLMIRPDSQNNTETICKPVAQSEGLTSVDEQINPTGSCPSVENSVSDKENDDKAEDKKSYKNDLNQSDFFKIGDLTDVKVPELGAWFEGKIIRIVKRSKGIENGLKEADDNVKSNHELENGEKESSKSICLGKKLVPFEKLPDDGLLYHMSLDGYEEDDPEELSINEIRPRAWQKVIFDNIVVGDFVMVNYNIEEPKKRGYWYDSQVTFKKTSPNQLFTTIYMGSDDAPLDNCKILYLDEIFRIEKTCKLGLGHLQASTSLTPLSEARSVKPRCDRCKDVTRKCKYCSCYVCGGKNDPSKQILCDECDMAYHLWCLNPPLSELPEEDEWYCPSCKNDTTEVVKAGEKLKDSKKKARMVSATSNSKRDWGKGMACVGRTKECTIVPHNHFGPIPSIEVGMMWKFRVQVSESGVHRPHVAGIHGRDGEGAFSIVLSGGYEDDVDKGEEFTYTGSGGRDLSGNKRTAEQSCDQTLTRMNKALALNCAAPLNNKSGAEAKNWKEGKPVRVIRNCKGAKHSTYCPEEGNRYDGLYKIVKYWPEKGKSGFLVWRYLLRRDDPTPAPWTKAGKKRIAELGYVIQYPEGYLETMAKKEEESATRSSKKKKSEKRARADESIASSPKKLKPHKYNLPPEISSLVREDKENSKLWDQCTGVLFHGQQRFLKEVEEVFTCVCCQELVFQPITTECQHNICKTCLKRSFKAEVYNCPMCRNNLGKDYAIAVNATLAEILIKLFPGYDTGR